ncbi:flagellar hook-associated protein FlgL [Trinickia caryophylli]|uniref:Flagellar hook-associated protein 3 FlgL n=1 Tax=Trinickia caryophylli TaxID=28094 RepID=A0A1X7FI11_TRICW|nr:flagellar hook-associated protein FlgL [Trinickia caryophylli]PMS13265.1 flagellar hook-associated protein 3 [Trinickia caryophylli]TRX19209.1 flagellar hook-associated protein 3 [Trinickia caryophylli]WQE13491.1 flagellar hook-associated protein FlgL [Trinickia caryophylli]SMF51852.1 flagellar hook-associated protein 3 FlgL [Trinickia caryophylli]GLU33980.1 flagellar hook-associated protein 3 [Trinickia caryophylli]
MRISTAQFYTQGVQTMGNQQSQLNDLYQQISTGQLMQTPGDNPLYAAQAVQLTMTTATISQYQTNQTSALSSLQLEDQTLSSVTNVMQSINSLVVRAGDGTLQDSDRAAIAKTIQGYRDELLTLANSSDSAGNYLFSGFEATTQPFTNNGSGGVNYMGDGGSRLVQVADTRQVATNDNGAAVFLAVPAIGTSAVAAGSASNTGTGTISRPTVTDASVATNSDRYTITFGGTSAAPTYTVTDNTLGTTTAATAFSTDTPIALGSGMTLSVKGAPAPGDTFTVTPATDSANSGVFSTIDSIIGALQTPADNNPTAKASLTNELAAGLTRFSNSMTAVTVVQASVGGREQELQALQTTTQNNALQAKNDLSNVTSVDMVAAVSQFSLAQTVLQAAQQSFLKVQSMSLFQYMS